MLAVWGQLEQQHQLAVGAAVGLALLVAALLSLKPKAKPALDSTKWQKFKLVDKIVISPNTAIPPPQADPLPDSYRFALPRGQVLGLPIGQHVSVSATINGKLVQRSYTPTSSDDDIGFFDLLIKVRPRPPSFSFSSRSKEPGKLTMLELASSQSYPTGNISRHFSELKVGDYVDVKGPKGQMRYSPEFANKIGMIAGGTGITPMLVRRLARATSCLNAPLQFLTLLSPRSLSLSLFQQIIRAALKNPLDKTQLSLIYANVSFEDILLKAELDRLASEHPEQFKVYYVLNNPPEGWTGGVGFVNSEMIGKHLPGHAENSKMLLCGPPPMMGAMKAVLLNDYKWPAPKTISKMGDPVFLF
ncbi:SPOSA6832_03719 [Sporobolomyces salmonicolor]|uniref:SPOSA6832_03719-mRNA-1:cds n=1 Tax=Sporidiobolus salmonicolor TaxID=5005 RepID=A0A0D6EPT5_SPOSA|nr:SPOSA6832_03719 [Sporobolomyces salmonicolor]